jgi:uroporphyrinogen-III synthase
MASPTLPLQGKRIVITRAEDRAGDFAQKLKALGAEPILLPCIGAEYLPPQGEKPNLKDYYLLAFTSPNAVNAFFKHWAVSQQVLCGHVVASIGPATSDALWRNGIWPVIEADVNSAKGLADTLTHIEGRRILFPCSDIAREELPELLEARGAIVTRLPVYKTIEKAPLEEVLLQCFARRPHMITFASPSAVRAFQKGMQDAALPLPTIAVASIGTTTTQEAQRLGLDVTITAEPQTIDGLIQTIIRHYAHSTETPAAS